MEENNYQIELVNEVNRRRELRKQQLEEEVVEEDEETLLPYELIKAHKLEEGEQPLGRVVGHDNQKKEILNVISWFKKSEELKAKGVSIVKGCLLFGEPGNGKSLLIKEILRCANAPIFIFRGEKSNVVEGIIETFKKAREVGHSIIVIDELDLLIDRDRRVIRALQECLDGVESSEDILVLAATNDLDEIPSPLLRHGRLEKLIHIPYPTGEEAVELLKKYFKEFNVALPADFDPEELALSLNNISCAGIKSVVNDIVLRNGFENITSEMIDNSIFNVTDRIKHAPREDNLEVSYHEASHCLMAKAYPQFFIINKLNISGASGEFHCKEVEKGFWPYDKVIANIKISMAGVIGQKLFFGRGSRGCEDDLQQSRVCAYNLINMCGASHLWETLPPVRQGARSETFIKRRRMERKIEKLLRKCEKETTKYIKVHAKEIKALGDLLYQKKHLKSSEILSVLG